MKTRFLKLSVLSFAVLILSLLCRAHKKSALIAIDGFKVDWIKLQTLPKDLKEVSGIAYSPVNKMLMLEQLWNLCYTCGDANY